MAAVFVPVTHNFTIIGLAADVKPTTYTPDGSALPIFTKYYAKDTGAWSVWDGAAWTAYSDAETGSSTVPTPVVEQNQAGAEDNTNNVFHVSPPFATQWQKYHTPAVGVLATITQAAPGALKRNVIRKFRAKLVGNTAAPAAQVFTVDFVEDAAGTPVILSSLKIGIQAIAGYDGGISGDCEIYNIAQNKTITIKFSGAGDANTFQSVAMEGDVITG